MLLKKHKNCLHCHLSPFVTWFSSQLTCFSPFYFTIDVHYSEAGPLRFFCKRPNSKCFKICRPHAIFVSLTLLFLFLLFHLVQSIKNVRFFFFLILGLQVIQKQAQDWIWPFQYCDISLRVLLTWTFLLCTVSFSGISLSLLSNHFPYYVSKFAFSKIV